MSEPAEQDSMQMIRRILVALDASSSSFVALDAAVDLAVRMEAELLGVFVEDAELLRAAESPFARELQYPYMQPAASSRTSLECLLRSQAEAARAALAGAAEKAQVRWTFRSVRGQVSPELLAAASEVDLIALGRSGWSLGRLRLGSTARELAGCDVPVLLLSSTGTSPGQGLLVYDDGTPAAAHALRLAACMAAADSRRLTVLLAESGGAPAEGLRDEAEQVLTGKNAGKHPIEVRYRVIPDGNEAGLRQVLRDFPGSILVVAGTEPLQRLSHLESALRENAISLLLVRDGES
ncbi:MAG: universal stress protein [Bryobacteraceae bacterium]